ncbi:MAG: YigZ family protein [Lachnospiraceae bacterium]|nr:YigZ family protein [Lachnospiraceae bacterium]
MMLEKYWTIFDDGTDEIIEKKSRFISYIALAETEEEALKYIEKLKKKYWDARHHCYAFRIGTEHVLERCSDDGEPSGTAGKPMLEVLAGKGLYNVVAVVIRYFGGTLLGTGGLVRAYTKSIQAGIEAAVLVEKQLGYLVDVVCDYSFYGKIQYIAATEGVYMLDTQYTDAVTVQLLVPFEKMGLLRKKLMEASCGAIQLDEGEQTYFGIVEKEVMLFD